MHDSRRSGRSRWSRLILVGSLVTGCAAMSPPPADQEVAGRKLQDALTKQIATNQDLEGKLATLRLALLEQNARNEELDRRLDDAILEVVRAKAKLRSVDSKAEAVSTLAEAEIALNALNEKGSSSAKDSHVLQAERLLRASGLELKKENYGGALYLATQAKSILMQGQERSIGRQRTPMLPGEVPFDLPLPLRSISASKVREGPGLDFKVLFSLPDGAPIEGLSYKASWVRVRSEDGRGGWVYYSLIDGR